MYSAGRTLFGSKPEKSLTPQTGDVAGRSRRLAPEGSTGDRVQADPLVRFSGQDARALEDLSGYPRARAVCDARPRPGRRMGHRRAQETSAPGSPRASGAARGEAPAFSPVEFPRASTTPCRCRGVSRADQRFRRRRIRGSSNPRRTAPCPPITSTLCRGRARLAREVRSSGARPMGRNPAGIQALSVPRAAEALPKSVNDVTGLKCQPCPGCALAAKRGGGRVGRASIPPPQPSSYPAVVGDGPMRPGGAQTGHPPGGLRRAERPSALPR